MLIREILSELTFTNIFVNEDNRRVRAIEPQTLDTIYNIQNYNRQVNAVKKQADDKLNKERQAAKQADTENRRKLDPEFKTTISVYMLPIDVKAVRYWDSSKNIEWIQTVAHSWPFVKKTWPKEVLADIYSDPVWQANVVRAFEIASMLLKIKQMPGSHATGRRALEDPSDALEVYYNLTNVVKHVLAKHNIDKHGRRLPPRR